jgi:hypothetical protein
MVPLHPPFPGISHGPRRVLTNSFGEEVQREIVIVSIKGIEGSNMIGGKATERDWPCSHRLGKEGKRFGSRRRRESIGL